VSIAPNGVCTEEGHDPDPPHDPLTRMLAACAWAVLLLVPAAFLVLLVFDGPGPRLEGTWIGRDRTDGEVVYHFGLDGRGYRMIGGEHERLEYSLTDDYPTEIAIRVDGAGDTSTYRGLLQFVSTRQIRVQLGPAGGRAPCRFTADAVQLRRPPSR
jgi:hypothetical protein